jgi:hypothetical protein
MEYNEEIYNYIKSHLESSDSGKKEERRERGERGEEEREREGEEKEKEKQQENYLTDDMALILKICTDTANEEDIEKWKLLTGGDSEAEEQIKNSFTSAYRLASHFASTDSTDSNALEIMKKEIEIAKKDMERTRQEIEREKEENEKLKHEFQSLLLCFKKKDDLTCSHGDNSNDLTSSHGDNSNDLNEKKYCPGCKTLFCIPCHGLKCNNLKHVKIQNEDSIFCKNCCVQTKDNIWCDHCINNKYF